MRLGDIGVLAEAIENVLPEIAKKNGGEDIRSRITVNIESTQKEIDALNLELYEITNHEVPSDELNSPREIDLDLVGIHFLISESFSK